MAIVISGVNNNDKITASDGTIDVLSGVTYNSEITVHSLKLGNNIQLGNAGIITATSFVGNISGTTGTFGDFLNVGSNIQLGNAGVATATTFVGNLTGNVNNTGNLLLQIGGSEKFRVGGSGQLGIGGANYGTSGQVLTSGGSGSAATWSTISSDSMSEGNTKAEVVDTGSDGHFKIKTEGTERLRIHSDGRTVIGGNASGTQPSATVGGAQFYGGSYPGDFRISSGAGASGTTTASIAIMGSNHNASIENGANSGAHLNLYNYNTTDGNSSGVMFMNSNGLAASRILGLNVSHSSRIGALVFMTSNGSHPTEKLRIDLAGQVLPGSDNAQNLGSSSKRWKNIYSADLHCSNKGSKNDVDGTWGDYTIQEGESDLFLINNRSGKKYKFNLTEVN